MLDVGSSKPALSNVERFDGIDKRSAMKLMAWQVRLMGNRRLEAARDLLHELRQTCAYELGNWEELKQIAESKIIIPCRLLSQINAACDGAIMELEKRRVQLQLLLQRNFR
jgi:hypothetical protein